jgi:hypothetical protein
MVIPRGEENRVGRSMAKATVLAAGLALVAGPGASAGTWYSSSSPLTAYEGGVAQAQGHGNMYLKDHTYARNDSWQKDPRSGGDPVYVRTQWKYFWEFTGVWANDDLKTTGRTSVNSWVFFYDHDALRFDRDGVRMITKVCEDQTFQGDPCSVESGQSFSY